MTYELSTINSHPGQKLPDGWRWVRLGNICKVVNGSTPNSAVDNYWNGDIVWITPTDLGKLDGLQITNSARRITNAGYESCGTEIVPSGSVVLSSRAPIGHLGIAAVPLCTNQGCKSFVPGNDVDSLFLYLSLKRVVPLLQAIGSGATFAEISKSQLESFEIALAPFSTQKRIAAILNQEMAVVERARAAAEAQLVAARDLLPVYLRAVFNSPVSDRWPKKRLREILSLRKEVIHPRDNPKGRTIFVGLEHIESGTGIRTGSLNIEKAELTGRKPCFSSGDIVYGYLRPYLNKVWVADFDGLCSVDQYVYKVDKDVVDAQFAAWFMRSPIYLKRAPISTTPGQLPRIRTEEVASVELNLPPLLEQRRITATLFEQIAAAEKTRNALEDQLATINKLPAALLRQAFSGEL